MLQAAMNLLPAFKLGTTELIVILVVVLLVLGPTQIPKLAKVFGKASKKFKEGQEEGFDTEDAKKETKSEKKDEA